jgi:hypothetical protein
VVVNDAAARLTRGNLFQTLVSFERTVDARIEFRFGLFPTTAAGFWTGSTTRRLGCD